MAACFRDTLYVIYGTLLQGTSANADTRILVSCLSHDSHNRMNKIQCPFKQSCCY